MRAPILVATLALTTLTGCWDCDFHVDEACVELKPGMDAWPDVELRITDMIRSARAYCGEPAGWLPLDGWRIRFVEELDGCGWSPYSAPAIGVVGCTNHLPAWLPGGHTVQVEIGGKGEGECLEHSSLLHELCHVGIDGVFTDRFHGSRLEAGMCESGIWQDATERVPSCSDQVFCAF
jgi:hypothetical protein